MKYQVIKDGQYGSDKSGMPVIKNYHFISQKGGYLPIFYIGKLGQQKALINIEILE